MMLLDEFQSALDDTNIAIYHDKYVSFLQMVDIQTSELYYGVVILKIGPIWTGVLLLAAGST